MSINKNRPRKHTSIHLTTFVIHNYVGGLFTLLVGAPDYVLFNFCLHFGWFYSATNNERNVWEKSPDTSHGLLSPLRCFCHINARPPASVLPHFTCDLFTFSIFRNRGLLAPAPFLTSAGSIYSSLSRFCPVHLNTML